MAIPTGTHSATVSLGYVNPGDGEQIYYLGSYYNDSCYSFYRGAARWLALSQYPGGSIIVPEAGAMFKSADNGATWTLTGGLSPSAASGGGASPSPAYDVMFAACDDVAIDPNDASKITAMANAGTGLLGHYAGFFADFDFASETWGGPYGSVDYPSIAISGAPVPSSTPGGGLAHTVIAGSTATPPSITVGATVVGSSPWTKIDAANNAHIGDDPGGHFVINRISTCGNVRIHGASLIFAQPNSATGHMEVLSRPVSGGTWTVQTVSVIDGLYAANKPPWMCDVSNLFFIGVNQRSIYLTQKTGSVWGAATQIWSLATDANPDLAGVTGGQVWQLIAGSNPILGGVDITFEYDAPGPQDAMFTFHLPGVECGCGTVGGGPAVTCGSPPDGIVGAPYSHSFPATGGTPPYTFTLTAGTLPPGLALASGTGNVSGTPTAAGAYPITLEVTDAVHATDTANCNINIAADTLGLGCAQPPNGVVGTPYDYTFPRSGGIPPFTFSIISGTLPPGLTLDAVNGEVSGTPTLAGDYNFTIEVDDDFGSVTGHCDILITVTDLPTPGITCDSPPDGELGVPYSHTFPVTNIPEGETVAYAITGGALPPGLTLNTATGEVTGTPTTDGHYHFTVTLTVSEPDGGGGSTIRGGNAVWYAPASSFTVAFPAGSLAGDTALMQVCGAYNITSPSGWTAIWTQGGTVWNGYIGWKILTSGDISTGSVTVNLANSYNGSSNIIVLEGAVTIREVVTFATVVLGVGTFVTSGAVQSTDLGIALASQRQLNIAPTFTPGTALVTASDGVDPTFKSSIYSIPMSTGANTIVSNTGGSNGNLNWQAAVIVVEA